MIAKDVNHAGEFKNSVPIIFMTQAEQFCTMQMANFLQMLAENYKWRVQLKIPSTE